METQGAAVLSFPWGPAVSFLINIKYDSRRHACKLKLYFPPRVHFGKTRCLQPAVSAHHSTRLLGVWCTLVASISTACIPPPSFHKAITFSPLSHFLLHFICTVLKCTVSWHLFFIKNELKPFYPLRFKYITAFLAKTCICLPLWVFNRQSGGDLIPCERQLRSYEYLFDIIHCEHVRITLRLKDLHQGLCSTWILISETINLIINRYMSFLPAPGPCLHENSKPIETREGGRSEPSS